MQLVPGGTGVMGSSHGCSQLRQRAMVPSTWRSADSTIARVGVEVGGRNLARFGVGGSAVAEGRANEEE